jgi:hypothetical protein
MQGMPPNDTASPFSWVPASDGVALHIPGERDRTAEPEHSQAQEIGAHRADRCLVRVGRWLRGRQAGIVALRAGLGDSLGIGLAVAVALVTVAIQLLYQYRGVVRPRGQGPIRFPESRPRA